MLGFCLGCPVPEILKSIEGDGVEVIEHRWMQDVELQQTATKLVRLIAKYGVCTEGPDFVDIDDGTALVGCKNEYWDKFADIAEIMSDPEAPHPIDLTSKVVRKEITS